MRAGIWCRLGDAVIAGVIDRDYRTDKQIAELMRAGCVVLDYHDAESYLCHPTVLQVASERSGKRKSEQEIIDELCKQCGERLQVQVALNRTFAATSMRLTVSPEAPGEFPRTHDVAIQKIDGWVDIEMQRVTDLRALVKDRYLQEFDLCRSALEQKNVDSILALFPGKEIIRPMAAFVGFSNPGLLLTSLTGVDCRSLAPLVKVFESLWRAA